MLNGYAIDFCENIVSNETTKTCRDIGARKKYDDKVKNDPICHCLRVSTQGGTGGKAALTNV